jgi:hypothetical protein
MGHESIGIAHLLLGIIDCKHSTARSLPDGLGYDRPASAQRSRSVAE